MAPPPHKLFSKREKKRNYCHSLPLCVPYHDLWYRFPGIFSSLHKLLAPPSPPRDKWCSVSLSGSMERWHARQIWCRELNRTELLEPWNRSQMSRVFEKSSLVCAGWMWQISGQRIFLGRVWNNLILVGILEFFYFGVVVGLWFEMYSNGEIV